MKYDFGLYFVNTTIWLGFAYVVWVATDFFSGTILHQADIGALGTLLFLICTPHHTQIHLLLSVLGHILC